MNFEIGDKVKIVSTDCCFGWHKLLRIGDRGTVIIVDRETPSVSYSIQCNTLSFPWWVEGHNIAPISSPGEQQLFDFMDGD